MSSAHGLKLDTMDTKTAQTGHPSAHPDFCSNSVMTPCFMGYSEASLIIRWERGLNVTECTVTEVAIL